MEKANRDGRAGRGASSEATRRAVLKAAGIGSAAGAFSALFTTGAAARDTTPNPAKGESKKIFEIEQEDVESVFPQSIVSGGPTPSGIIAWTRIDSGAYQEGTPLGIEVATDDAFEDIAYRGTVPASEIDPAYDYTVNADLDGELAADTEYAYRFVYDGDSSRIGHCRTLPEPNASPDEVSFAILSCNNYLHGYFGGFAHVADEDVDFLVHLGDFIYEYAGEGQQPGRSIELPSGNDVAFNLADFRHLHRVYRSDEFMQRALEEHTLIHIWDDHEIVNNRWWNYEANAPETESHPQGDDPAFMRQLYVEGIKAMIEYIPARVGYEPASENGLAEDAIQEDFTLYRSFRFGDLCELFMTDERLYRSPPPEDAFGRRDTGTPPSEENDDPDRTILGTEQRRWFTDGVTDSDATWKLWGNEIFAAPLKTTNTGENSFYLNYDAWDGYQFERKRIMGDLNRAGVENFVAFTGDMHTYIAAYLLEDYETLEQTARLPDEESRVGVEFMTPGVTSDNLAASEKLPPTLTEDTIETTVKSQNPHIEFFNSSRWGYTVVDVTRDDLTYTAYDVDRSVNSADAPRQLLRIYRVPEGQAELQELRRSPTDKLVSTVDGVDSGGTTDGPDVFSDPDASGGDGL